MPASRLFAVKQLLMTADRKVQHLSCHRALLSNTAVSRSAMRCCKLQHLIAERLTERPLQLVMVWATMSLSVYKKSGSLSQGHSQVLTMHFNASCSTLLLFEGPSAILL